MGLSNKQENECANLSSKEPKGRRLRGRPASRLHPGKQERHQERLRRDAKVATEADATPM